MSHRADKVFKDALSILREAGNQNPQLDAKVILMSILNIPPHHFFLRDLTLDDKQLHEFNSAINRRAKFEPVAYITGKKEFYSLEFSVTKDVLIPRPETEHIVERIITEAPKDSSLLDLCTGSGCIAITIARSRQDLHISASDISQSAVDVALQNAKNLKAEEIDFRLGDLFNPWQGMQFDTIVVNPPYVDFSEKETLMPDVLLYEPKIAIFAEQKGLEIYRKIFEQAADFLTPDGKLVMEIGDDMEKAIVPLAQKLNWKVHSFIKEYSERIRGIVLNL